MKVKVHESIEKIDKTQWDSIIGRNRIICSHDYLKAVERSGINNCKYYYPVAYKDNKIIAHTSVYTISTELDLFAQGKTKQIIELIRRKWVNFLVLRSIECGTPVALGNTISFAEGADRAEAFESIHREIEGLGEKLNLKMFLFRDFYEKELCFFDSLTGKNYARIHNLPNAKIPIRWKSFEEYLDSMKSNYRRKIIKRMEHLYLNNVSVELLEDFSEYSDDLLRLWTNVNNNAKEYCREKLTASFFKNLDTCMGSRSRIILMKKNNVPVGCALLLFDDDVLVSMYYGLDYKYNKDFFLYFNLLYKTVEIAIEYGMKEVDMGITTLVPKKDLGADIIPLYMYMKYTMPGFRMLVPKAFDSMTPQDELMPRNVFKDGDCVSRCCNNGNIIS